MRVSSADEAEKAAIWFRYLRDSDRLGIGARMVADARGVEAGVASDLIELSKAVQSGGIHPAEVDEVLPHPFISALQAIVDQWNYAQDLRGAVAPDEGESG